MLNRKLINELLSKYSNYNIRIREGKNAEVYYDGFKPFEVNSKLSSINREMLYFNSTNINKCEKSSNMKADFIKKISDLRDYYYKSFYINRITFKIGEYGESNTKEREKAINDLKNQKGCEKIEKNIKKRKNGNKFTEYEIKCDFKSITEEYEIFKILWNKYVDTKNNSNVFKEVKVHTDRKCKPKKLTLNKVCLKIPELVSNYETYTKTEFEKKYQHFYLLNTFELSESQVIPFEEEYCIQGKTENKKSIVIGRIDCIFYSAKDNRITDIFLVELKVDTGVIGGKQGLHKHLIDIKNLDDKFYKNLLEHINERRIFFGENELNYELNKIAKHFFIVCGYTENTNKKLINSIKELNDINSKIYDSVPNDIDEKGKRPIKEIMNEIEDVDIQLFIDEKKWNEKSNYNEFHPKYENYTYILKGE